MTLVGAPRNDVGGASRSDVLSERHLSKQHSWLGLLRRYAPRNDVDWRLLAMTLVGAARGDVGGAPRDNVVFGAECTILVHFRNRHLIGALMLLERETGFEPATPSLEGSYSTN